MTVTQTIFMISRSRTTLSAPSPADVIDTSSARGLHLCCALHRADDLRAEAWSSCRSRRERGIFLQMILCEDGHARTEVRAGIGVPVSGVRRSLLTVLRARDQRAHPPNIRADIIGSAQGSPGTERGLGLFDFPVSCLLQGGGRSRPASAPCDAATRTPPPGRLRRVGPLPMCWL